MSTTTIVMVEYAASFVLNVTQAWGSFATTRMFFSKQRDTSIAGRWSISMSETHDVYFEHSVDRFSTDDTGEYSGLRDLDLTSEIVLAMNALTEKQLFVLKLRYGMCPDDEVYTQDEIAEIMGVEQQSVARIEEHALARLRDFFT